MTCSRRDQPTFHMERQSEKRDTQVVYSSPRSRGGADAPKWLAVFFLASINHPHGFFVMHWAFGAVGTLGKNTKKSTLGATWGTSAGHWTARQGKARQGKARLSSFTSWRHAGPGESDPTL